MRPEPTRAATRWHPAYDRIDVLCLTGEASLASVFCLEWLFDAARNG